jgi:hypothetical protein
MVRMAGLGAFAAGSRTYLAMLMVMHTTFISTHPANLFAQQQILMGYSLIYAAATLPLVCTYRHNPCQG